MSISGAMSGAMSALLQEDDMDNHFLSRFGSSVVSVAQREYNQATYNEQHKQSASMEIVGNKTKASPIYASKYSSYQRLIEEIITVLVIKTSATILSSSIIGLLS